MLVSEEAPLSSDAWIATDSRFLNLRLQVMVTSIDLKCANLGSTVRVYEIRLQLNGLFVNCIDLFVDGVDVELRCLFELQGMTVNALVL